MSLKRLAGTTWGGHPRTMMTVYRALVQSVVDYGCQIHGDWLKQHDKKIQKELNALLRIANGLTHTTPSNIISVIANEPACLLHWKLATNGPD